LGALSPGEYRDQQSTYPKLARNTKQKVNREGFSGLDESLSLSSAPDPDPETGKNLKNRKGNRMERNIPCSVFTWQQYSKH
jgi:hypothetical protein